MYKYVCVCVYILGCLVHKVILINILVNKLKEEVIDDNIDD